MRRLFRNAMTLAAIAVCIAYACVAQSTTTQPTLTASVDPSTAPRGADATQTSSSAAKPELQPTVTQEIEALKGRIEQLEQG